MNSFKLAALGAVAALSIGGTASAQHAGHSGMTAEQHQKMMGSKTSTEKATHATGVVKSKDAAKGTITVAHDPIASKNWPAMTMTFKASKGVLGNIKAGQRVKFSFEGQGSNYTVTKISRR